MPIKDILFVLLQFALFIAFAFEIGTMRIYFPVFIFWIGVGILVLGALTTLMGVLQLNIHLSPFPSPLPGAKLIDSGVYKYIRHPIYTGVIFAFLGFSLIAGSGYKLSVTVMLYVLFHLKTEYEEKRLLMKFPQYLDYKQKTGRFFPNPFKKN